MIFKRRRNRDDVAAGEDRLGDEGSAAADAEEVEDEDLEPGPDADVDVVAEAEDGDVDGDQRVGNAVADYDRTAGPYDITEVEAEETEGQRIDLGGLQVPLVEGLEIRVEIEQESNQPVAVTLIRGEGAIQVRPFAAPRSGGTWREALTEIRREFSEQGGTVDESVGPFGVELRTMVAGTDEQGRNVVQPIRFVGVEGPRWMLQGVLFGAGTVAETAGELEELFRSVVVVRGEAAMRPGAPLPISLPEQVPDDVEAEIEEYDDEPDELDSGNGTGPGTPSPDGRGPRA